MYETSPSASTDASIAALIDDARHEADYLAWLAQVDEDRASSGAYACVAAAIDTDAASDLPWAVLSGADHDRDVDRLDVLACDISAATAAQYRLIGEVLREAAEVPEPWVGADPTLDPLWVDPRDRSVAAVRSERREFAVRAATADIAVRLRLSETTIRTRGHHADTLRVRCPHLWAAFGTGAVAERNAIAAAEYVQSLPDDAEEAWKAFDARVTDVASVLTPAKFRTRARIVREQVHAESIEVRAKRAAESRDVWLTPELDGMATISARLPAGAAYEALGLLDAAAAHLRAQGDEPRTLAQLRADAFVDRLLAATVDADGARKQASRPSVAVTVPVLRLLDASDGPATLHGYGPIDLDTAKRLAGTASSWVRIRADPADGSVLDVDRTTRRVPADLRRWVEVRHPLCIFPGCHRLAPATATSTIGSIGSTAGRRAPATSSPSANPTTASHTERGGTCISIPTPARCSRPARPGGSPPPTPHRSDTGRGPVSTGKRGNLECGR